MCLVTIRSRSAGHQLRLALGEGLPLGGSGPGAFHHGQKALGVTQEVIRFASADDRGSAGPHRFSLRLRGGEEGGPFGELRGDIGEHPPDVPRPAASGAERGIGPPSENHGSDLQSRQMCRQVTIARPLG